MQKIQDLHVITTEALVAPRLLKEQLAIDDRIARTVVEARQTVRRIIRGEDSRLMCIVGPCSIHDPAAALDYAERLARLRAQLEERLFIVMRVYFEKPRTTVGWKGMINDPHMDDSCDMREGLFRARRLLLDINALESARRPHSFIGITQDGMTAIVRTAGNPDTHVVLRGGRTPNYDAVSIDECCRILRKAGLEPRVMVDCSHAQTSKDYRKQPEVFAALCEQVRAGSRAIMGVMLESFINAGNQPLTADRSRLEYGVSITDPCIDWPTTERCLLEAAETLAPTRRVDAAAAE